jgi:hypothetical protein
MDSMKPEGLVIELGEALVSLVGLFDMEAWPSFVVLKVGSPMTSGDQDRIDAVFVQALAAIEEYNKVAVG